jgi:pimeloyl-ACP methyl ester carboxylesterase
MTLPALVTDWQAQGAIEQVGGHDLFVVDTGAAEAPVLVMLHGFPGSSFDWRRVVPALTPRWRVITFDFLGFGLSAKPDRAYSLFAQADLVEELLAARGVSRAALLAHDMGDTVAAELLARAGERGAGDSDGDGDGPVDGVDWVACLLTNGSIFIDMAQLTSGQQLLLSLPDEMTADSLGADGMANGLQASFPPGRPSAEEMQAMVALILRDGGDRLLPRTIRYVEERRAHQPRWTSALVDYPGTLVAAWGDLDPIAVPAMPDRLEELRAEAGHDLELVHWPDIGHWPSVEDPDLVAGLVASTLQVL